MNHKIFQKITNFFRNRKFWNYFGIPIQNFSDFTLAEIFYTTFYLTCIFRPSQKFSRIDLKICP